jgi:hypothetical protein
MKNLGLAHHFHGKAQQVGAAECKQENWQAIAELIQKLEKRHGADALYEDKENHSRGAAVRSSLSFLWALVLLVMLVLRSYVIHARYVRMAVAAAAAASLHMPATRQRYLFPRLCMSSLFV